MKKLFMLICFTISIFTIGKADAPCPTGVTTVQTSWWPPNNDTWYTLCGCQAVKGYSASGSCGGPE